MTNSRIVDLENVGVSYSERQALQECTLRIGAGESVAILGPNGAGKTTMLEVIAGFRRPSQGHATVFGVNPLEFDAPTLSRIGIVIQNWRDHSTWRVRDVIDLVEFSHHQVGRGSPEYTRELVEVMGLYDLLNSKLIKLSGGERRRVDTCLALISQPDLLILDEPTTALDPNLRHRFHELIAKIRGGETAVLWATHDLSEAEDNCERIVLLNHGRIIRDASPAELRSEVEGGVLVKWRDSAGNPRSQKVKDPDMKLRELVLEGGTEIRISDTSFEDVYLDLLNRMEIGDDASTRRI